MKMNEPTKECDPRMLEKMGESTPLLRPAGKH